MVEGAFGAVFLPNLRRPHAQRLIETKVCSDKLPLKKSVVPKKTEPQREHIWKARAACPKCVVETHFFSPVPVIRLVEVIRGDQTEGSIVDRVLEFCRAIGKTPILARDVPGFIVNRFLCLLYNEAADQIYKGYAIPQDIDLGLKLGSNHPMRPVEIMDMAGVDVVHNALKALFEMTGEERYRPSPLFKQMISENRLGRKTRRGFYKYK